VGLPQVLIEFKAKADPAVKRSENGIVAVILKDTTNTTFDTKIYKNEGEIVTSHWNAANRDYLSKIFLGAPSRVIVERIGTSSSTIPQALDRAKNKAFHYLCMPGATVDDAVVIGNWIKTQRDSNKKTYKAVLANSAANHEGIINFTTEGIKAGTKTYTAVEYCCRIAGILAGLPLTRSATYAVLPEVETITESTAPDTDIDAGKLILINDGAKIKIARGVNSLVTLSGDKTEDMKKIKIIEGMDIIRDDIRSTFEAQYIGENNSYDNKVLFIAAVNQYFKLLVMQGVLYDKYDNHAEIDIDTQTEWLMQQGDISGLDEEQIKTADTKAIIFAAADIKLQDSIEDLRFRIAI
jgi:hypothetical protein